MIMTCKIANVMHKTFAYFIVILGVWDNYHDPEYFIKHI